MHFTMSSNESRVTERVTEFYDGLVRRFREEAAIHASLRNLIKLEQTKNNVAQLKLMALRVKKTNSLGQAIRQRMCTKHFQKWFEQSGL
jgi:hypothetical protein